MQDSLENTLSILFGKKIAVDLTPMLPGGDNGGGKLMTLELLHTLTSLLPKTSFVLLTAESSHAELDQLENEHPNIQRMCVWHSRIHTDPSIIVRPPELVWSKDIFIDQLKNLARQVISPALKDRIKRWRWVAKFTARPTKFLREMKVDLLFCPFTAPFYADGLIPTVSVVYDLQYRAYPQFFTPEELIEREDNFQMASQKSDYLVTISEFVREKIIEAASLSPERVITIPIGLLHTQKRPDDDSGNRLLEKYGLHHGEYILYPANFWQHKNHTMLLTAFSMYRKAQPDSKLKLLCTGAPGPRAEAFCEKASRMGLADWVIYPGYVTSYEYDCLLRSAFALIFPSLYEGFGIPVLEAMSAGVPVLSSDVASLPEVGGDAALYFDPHQPTQIMYALIRLSREPGLRDSLITRGLQRSIQYEGGDRMARQYANVFAKTLKLR